MRMSSLVVRKLGFAVLILAACNVVPAFAEGPVAATTVKLAVVDMDRVMAESILGKAEQAAIDRMRSGRTSIITQKQKELEAEEEQIRNASLSWSAEKRDERLRSYETKRIELRRLSEDATRDVQAEFNRSLAKLQRGAFLVTSEIGKEKGYTLILEKRSQPVIFASDAIDITTEVVKRMDSLTQSPDAPSPGGGGKR